MDSSLCIIAFVKFAKFNELIDIASKSGKSQLRSYVQWQQALLLAKNNIKQVNLRYMFDFIYIDYSSLLI